jgi:hypothetical protein
MSIKNIFVIFLIMIFAVGCKKESNPTTQNNSSLVSGTDSFNGDEQGFDFSTKTRIQLTTGNWIDVPSVISQIDLGWSDRVICGSPSYANSYLWCKGIIDLGGVDLSTITEAPSSGYSTQFISSTLNHTYCLITQDANYVKFKITSRNDTTYNMTFTWVEQTDGTRNFQ